ncbi:SRPBCC family protein [Schlegelella sp. S2-27]|uniref:SRPBCC family protein n=1 Tax=Caldimonas mangrovi TaxID=2944811 RepID=A0ABT0YR35_9BURK|nr:SRPBCC family protein [Caldimonas mangrovi]MCM5681190.1 SRPBCC family protein [Caldimonas mangrovi]
MTPLADAQVHICRPVGAVFGYVIDMERFAEWFPHVMHIESANALSCAQVGKEYLESVKVPLRGVRRIRLTVREVQHEQRFVTEGRFSPLMPRMEVSFAEREGGTDVMLRMFSRSDRAVVRWLLLPWAARVLQRRVAAGAVRLKAKLEGASGLS